MPAEEWDVFEMPPPSEDVYVAPTYLATLYEAYGKSIRVELNGAGTGQFTVNKDATEATAEILAQGNLVKVRFPEIDDDYLFAFFIETGDFTLISSQEEGGEALTFGGRGALMYTEYAQAWSESYIDGGQDPVDGVWRAYAAGTGNKPGQILRRMIEEMQDPDRPQQPLPLLTIDFDYDDDSDGNTWEDSTATDEFSYQVGEKGLAIIERLVQTEAITIQMGPDFDLHAYNSYGVDKTATVHFERGVNIANELLRQLEASRGVTHMLVGGELDRFGYAVASGAALQPVKEGFVTNFGTDATALNGIGAMELETLEKRTDRVTFQIANRRTDVVLTNPVSVGSVVGPVASDGHYLPGPAGTNGDFWLGDTVRLHTGSSPFDFTNREARVMAITIARNDQNAELDIFPEVEILPLVACPDVEATPTDYYPPFIPTGVPFDEFARDPDDFWHYTKGGVPDPASTSNQWHFPDYHLAWVGSHEGFIDQSHSVWGNRIFGYPKGDGELTIYALATDPVTYTVSLLDILGNLIEEVGTGIPANTPFSFDISQARDGLCEHIVAIDWAGGKLAFDGGDWVSAS